jgi:hypothetical protein
MKETHALILCNADPNSNPRPNRMIHWLKDEYAVTVIGWNRVRLEDVESIPLFGEDQADLEKIATGKYRGIKRIQHILLYIYRLLSKRYEDILWLRLGRARELRDRLSSRDFDLIISHDITLLPLAFNIKNDQTKVMLDAREYYPRQYEDRWKWRLLTKPVNQYLCDRYLHMCDKIITVNGGIAQAYAREYGVLPEVIMSLPHFVDLHPGSVSDKIKIVYHGYAHPSRGTAMMIEMMDFLDDRFRLDMMLVVSQGKYWEKIVSMVEARKNVNIIPPVLMHEIVPYTSRYDIGLYLCPSSNFNQKYTLPNKFFEFIQARLAVAIGPSIEMKKIVEEYDCGVVSSDFTPKTLAKQLNALTTEKITYYKNQSHKAASVLNADTNRRRIKEIVSELIGA